MKVVDHTGKRYGRLLVTGKAPKKDHRVHWVCKCDCGNTVIVAGTNLTRGLTKSCGCLRKERNPDAAKIAFFKRLVSQAKSRKIVFRLTEAQVLAVGTQNCAYCGAPPQHQKWSSRNQVYEVDLNGLDRIDSSKGYTIDNVVPCCARCNRAKHVSSAAEFRGWIVSVYNHLMGDQK